MATADGAAKRPCVFGGDAAGAGAPAGDVAAPVNAAAAVSAFGGRIQPPRFTFGETSFAPPWGASTQAMGTVLGNQLRKPLDDLATARNRLVVLERLLLAQQMVQLMQRATADAQARTDRLLHEHPELRDEYQRLTDA